MEYENVLKTVSRARGKRRLYGVKFGISISNLGIYCDVDGLIAVAQDAEEAGWDGIFPWDHIVHKPRADLRAIDPWIALAAIARARHLLDVALGKWQEKVYP